MFDSGKIKYRLDSLFLEITFLKNYKYELVSENVYTHTRKFWKWTVSSGN